jgi:chemotaxis protein CheY-P-specific phosphatase CheC
MTRANEHTAAAAGVRALAQDSAQAAATALGQLCGREVQAADVRVCEASLGAGAGKLETGILFEADGAVRGIVALLLSSAGRAAVLEALGAEALADSALREVGNIVASHSVSAVADRLGDRVTLSVPTLVREEAGSVVAGLLARRGDIVVTATELSGLAEAPCALLVFAAQAP